MILKLKEELSNYNAILDVGCGPNSRIQFVEVPYSVGIELFGPYIKESKKKNIHNEYIQADIRKIDFAKNSFDAVICIDVIEHLKKEEAYDLIKKMESWASNKVIIYTPNGYLWQRRIDNNPQQEHKSGWDYKELEELNYTVYGMGGWKILRGSEANFKYKPYLIWRIIADITQLLTYNYPSYAFGLFGIKEKKNKK